MRIFRRARWVVVIGVVAAVAAGVSYAAIPSSNGTISACLDAKGGLKVIDVENGDTCGANTKVLAWNQRGPQGAPGPQGLQGVPGPSDAYVKFAAYVVPFNGWTTTTSVNLPAGKYVVSAKVWLHNETFGTKTSTSCYVGTGLNDVWDFQYAQTYANSGITDAEVSLLTSRVLAAPALVKLQCYDGSGAISAKNAVISAIKVGNLA